MTPRNYKERADRECKMSVAGSFAPRTFYIARAPLTYAFAPCGSLSRPPPLVLGIYARLVSRKRGASRKQISGGRISPPPATEKCLGGCVRSSRASKSRVFVSSVGGVFRSDECSSGLAPHTLSRKSPLQPRPPPSTPRPLTSYNRKTTGTTATG